MALFAFYHYAYIVGTYLLIKAQNEQEAYQLAVAELEKPFYEKQDLTRLYFFKVCQDETQEEKYRAIFLRMNKKLIKDAFNKDHSRV